MFCWLRKWWNPLKGYCSSPFEANSSPFVEGVGGVWGSVGVTFLLPEVAWGIMNPTCLQVTSRQPPATPNIHHKGKARLKCSAEPWAELSIVVKKTRSLKINPTWKISPLLNAVRSCVLGLEMCSSQTGKSWFFRLHKVLNTHGFGQGVRLSLVWLLSRFLYSWF